MGRAVSSPVSGGRSPVGLLVCLLAAAGCPGPEPEPEPVAFTLLQANVGNATLACEPYLYKLCYADVEERIAGRLAELAPDIVVLQEVLPADFCDGIDEPDPEKICHPSRRLDEPWLARRLVGPDYELACDTRNGFECIGVRQDVGTLSGPDAVTPPLAEGCDPGFSVSSTVVTLAAGPSFTVVDGHPQSGWEYACREDQVRLLFGGARGEPPLVADGPTLVAGDMNLDPFVDADVSVRAWDEFVGEGRRFHYHSGLAERDPPYDTLVTPVLTGVLDHVVSDFAEGTCQTLGEAPGTERLDDGAGCDHRALLCDLEVPVTQ